MPRRLGADIVLASDPDADRIGVAVRNEEGKDRPHQRERDLLPPDLLRHRQRRDAGLLQPTDYVVKTIVTTELIRAIAEKSNVILFDCYTGFKWIADVIRKNEAS